MSNEPVLEEAGDAAPWRTDPLLAGRFNPEYPDDLQVIVHDGGPRFTDNVPEVVWVTVTSGSKGVYLGRILNQPQSLESVKKGDEILFLACDEAPHPFMTSQKYLAERGEWVIQPCQKCGFSHLFDAPSDLIARVFTDIDGDSTVEVFTSFCPLCRGVQVVHKPGYAGE